MPNRIKKAEKGIELADVRGQPSTANSLPVKSLKKQKKGFSLKSRVEIYHTQHSEIIKQVKNHQRVHRTNEIRPYAKTFPSLH